MSGPPHLLLGSAWLVHSGWEGGMRIEKLQVEITETQKQRTKDRFTEATLGLFFIDFLYPKPKGRAKRLFYPYTRNKQEFKMLRNKTASSCQTSCYLGKTYSSFTWGLLFDLEGQNKLELSNPKSRWRRATSAGSHTQPPSYTCIPKPTLLVYY